MKRFLVWFFGVLLGLAFLVVGTGFWFASTNAGSERLVRIAEYVLEGALVVGATSGRIGDSFCVATASFTGESVHVAAEELCVGVDLAHLAFDDELLVRGASARQLVITTTPPSEPESEELFPIEFVLPLNVIVTRLAVAELRVDDVHVTSIDLAGSATQRRATIEPARATYLAHQFEFRGGFAWRERGIVNLDITVRGDQVDADIATQGSLGDLAWQLSTRTPVVASASGRVDLLDDGLPYRLEIRGQDIALGEWIDRPTAISGVLAGSGDIDGYEFGFGGRLDDDQYGTVTLDTSGAGNWQEAYGELTARTDVGNAVGTARVAWSPEFSFETELALADVDLTSEYTNARVSGDLKASGTAARIAGEAIGLRGLVNEVAFTAGGEFEWSPDQLDVSDVVVNVGEGKLSGRMRIAGEALETDLSATRLGLSQLDVRLGGVLDGHVRANGRWPELDLQGQVTVVEPRYDEFSAQSLRVDMDAVRQRPLRVDAVGVSSAAGSELGDFQIAIGGALEAGSSDLTWHREGARLLGHIDYRWDEPRLSGDLDVLEIEWPGLGVWRGSQPAAFAVGNGSVELAELCLARADGAQVCGAVAYPQGETTLRLQGVALRQMPLSDSALKLSADIAADAEFSKLAPDLEGAARVRVSQLEVLLDPDAQPYRLGEVQGSADITAAGARGTLATGADSGVTLDLEFSTDGLQSDAAINGQGRVALQDLALLDPFLPDEVGELQGRFAGQFELLGSLDAPLWLGELDWSDGQLRIVPLGALLTGVSARVAAADSLSANLQLNADGGTGVLRASAPEVGLGAVRQFQATLDLDRAKVMDLPDYQMWLSGQLAVLRRDGILEVTGELTVPEAAINIKQLPEEAVGASADVVISDEEQVEDVLGRKMDLKVGFGDDVRVSAFGLDTGVTGRLRLRESPSRPLQVSGVLDLREGVFAAYGQQLAIQRGRLIFNGPIDNPTLDVVAERRIESDGESYQVSLNLTGPANRITTRVISRPATTEADALALLITGRRLHDSSRTERVNLAAAAQVLGIKSASLFTDRIGGVLGVDEIIVAGDEENLEVGAGMQINPNLYLRYTYDVFSRLGGVLLNYQLTRNLSLHGKSGDAQSIKLNYEVDL